MLKRPTGYLFVGVFVVALLGCKNLLHHPNRAAPIAVDACPALPKFWQETIETVGTLTASQGIVIKPELSGRITAIYFHSGETVPAGTPLVQLNPDIIQAKLDAAKAQTQLSAANYQRALILYKQKVFAKADLDKALASYHSDEAQQAQAQATLDQTLIRAPFSGRLGLRLVDQGDFVDSNKALVNLDAINHLRVDFKVPGLDIGKLGIGATVLIHTDSYPNQTLTATVYAIDSQIDVNTRSLGVRASLNNEQQRLLPGGFVTVSLLVAQPQRLATVPETAVYNDAVGSYVYRIVNHKAVKTPVSVRFHQHGEMGLVGIQPGEQIISVGGFKVTDHASVSVEK